MAEKYRPQKTTRKHDGYNVMTTRFCLALLATTIFANGFGQIAGAEERLTAASTKNEHQPTQPDRQFRHHRDD